MGNRDGTGDVYYDLTLKEYRAVEIKKTKLKKKKENYQKEKQTKKTSGKEKDKTYTVKSGDCLWNIAKRFMVTGLSTQRFTTLTGVKSKIQT